MFGFLKFVQKLRTSATVPHKIPPASSSNMIPNTFFFNNVQYQKMEFQFYRILSRLRNYWLELTAFFILSILLMIWLIPSSETHNQLYHESVARGKFEPDDAPVEHNELLRKFGEKRVFNVPSVNDEAQEQVEETEDPKNAIKKLFYTPIKQDKNTKLVSTSIWKKIKKQKSKFKKKDGHYALCQTMMDELNWNAQLRISPWMMARHWVQPTQITPAICSKLGSVLHAMATAPIVNVSAFRAGSNFKVMLHFEGGQRAVFKPLLHPITEIIEGPSYVGADRHYGEIASFHLNRLLGFNRAPIVVGRKINLRREMLPVATPEITKTFFTNGQNMCFYGVCTYCRKEFPACAKGDIIEGSLTLFLPLQEKHYDLLAAKNPWIRTYQDGFVAKWQVDKKYCKQVKADKVYHSLFNRGRRLLDLIDMSIFDFLIGNGDRAQYEMFNATKAAILLLDNGKSFNNPNLDDIEILSPLYECCKLRKSTYDRLQMFAGGALSESLEMILSHDPITPVLNEQHLAALDRRLELVLRVIKICVKERGSKKKFLVTK